MDRPDTTPVSRWRTRDRVGIDVMAIDQVAWSVDHFGERYLARVYSPAELADCAGRPVAMAASLAARFAAKEAVRKVLRSSDGHPWSGIEIRRAPWGGCEVNLDEATARLAEEQGITALSLSMSHEDGMAVAIALAQCDRPVGPRPAGRVGERGAASGEAHS
ncbi:MAG: 4'-phosphopantetheinyl transferase superfamily protein [Actinomycetota bacterium]|nr:4'-phosphopantetheinyl transferase superfamily protein [Actinomycetota bacterium]